MAKHLEILAGMQPNHEGGIDMGVALERAVATERECGAPIPFLNVGK